MFPSTRARNGSAATFGPTARRPSSKLIETGPTEADLVGQSANFPATRPRPSKRYASTHIWVAGAATRSSTSTLQ
jgi:hypothetical protein